MMIREAMLFLLITCSITLSQAQSSGNKTYLRNPEDCKSYFILRDDKIIKMSCPEGLHWYDRYKICDIPESANCVEDNCTEFSYLPNRHDCKSYFQCIEGEKILKLCEVGMYWNDMYKTCDWPENTECREEEITTVPNENTTEVTDTTTSMRTEKPITESPETEEPQTNPTTEGTGTNNPGTENSTTQSPTTNYSTETENPNTENPTTEHTETEGPETEGPETEGPETEGPETEGPETEGPETEVPETEGPETGGPETDNPTTTNPETEDPNITNSPTSTPEITTEGSVTEVTTPITEDPETSKPESCNHGELSPNEENCSTFFQCVHGQKILKQCPDNLHWNNELKICDWSNSAGCLNGSSEDICTHGDYLSNSEDCGSFFQCVHNVLVKQQCPDALHWNNELKVCDWPQSANCLTEFTTENYTSQEIPTTTNTIKDDETSTKQTSSEDNSTAGSNECVHGEYLPNPNDCGKFQQCSHGILYDHDCPGELHWNTKLDICDWPLNANCNIISSTETEYPTTEDPTSEESISKESSEVCIHGDLLPNKDNCNTYYNCVHGLKVLMKCPNKLHWNDKLKICDWPQSAGCELSESSEEVCSHGEYLSNSYDCGSFYQCVHNVLVKQQCPNGLHWNNMAKVCDLPSRAHCVISPTESSTTKAPTSEELIDSDESSSEEISTSSENKCVHGEYLPNPKNCGSFLQCSHGILYNHLCPQGLHWNSKFKICTWPFYANCKL